MALVDHRAVDPRQTLATASPQPRRIVEFKRAWAWPIALLLASLVVMLATVGSWSDAAPSGPTGATLSALRIECEDRVSLGLSPDMGTCLSWAAEQVPLDSAQGEQVSRLAFLLFAISAGLLAGLVVLAVPFRPTRPVSDAVSGSRT